VVQCDVEGISHTQNLYTHRWRAGQDEIMQIEFVTIVLQHTSRGAKAERTTPRQTGVMAGLKDVGRKVYPNRLRSSLALDFPKLRESLRTHPKGLVLGWKIAECRGTDAVVGRVRQGSHDDRTVS